MLEGFAIDVTSIFRLFQGHNRLLDVCASTAPWPVVLTVFDHLKHAGHAINTATVKLGDGEMGGVCKCIFKVWCVFSLLDALDFNFCSHFDQRISSEHYPKEISRDSWDPGKQDVALHQLGERKFVVSWWYQGTLASVLALLPIVGWKPFDCWTRWRVRGHARMWFPTTLLLGDVSKSKFYTFLIFFVTH